MGLKDHQIFKDKLILDFSYFDMKDGILRCKINQSLSNYWLQQLSNYPQLKEILENCKLCSEQLKPSPKPADCLSICNARCVIDGFGSKILEKLLDNEECNNLLSTIQDAQLTQSQKIEWTAIGKLIFEWCCSAAKIRV